MRAPKSNERGVFPFDSLIEPYFDDCDCDGCHRGADVLKRPDTGLPGRDFNLRHGLRPYPFQSLSQRLNKLIIRIHAGYKIQRFGQVVQFEDRNEIVLTKA